MFLPKFILSFIENLQSVHNMKLPHKFILDLAEKMTLVDYKETERSDFWIYMIMPEIWFLKLAETLSRFLHWFCGYNEAVGSRIYYFNA